MVLAVAIWLAWAILAACADDFITPRGVIIVAILKPTSVNNWLRSSKVRFSKLLIESRTLL
jgi:hypothetical protein